MPVRQQSRIKSIPQSIKESVWETLGSDPLTIYLVPWSCCFFSSAEQKKRIFIIRVKFKLKAYNKKPIHRSPGGDPYNRGPDKLFWSVKQRHHSTWLNDSTRQRSNWGETEENISAESPCPFLIHITGTSGTVAVLSAFRRGSSTKAGFSVSGSWSRYICRTLFRG